MSELKLLSMTVSCVDLFPDLHVFYLGGNSLNFATQCRESGLTHVAVLGAVGHDVFGDEILHYYEQKGIDVSHVYQMKGETASNRIYIDAQGDRYFLPDSWRDGLFATFRLSEADWQFAQQFDAVHMPTTDPNFLDACKKLTHTPLIADFLDTSNLLFFEQRLPFVEIAFVNSPKDKIRQFKSLSHQYHVLIVLTHGSEGSTALWENQTFFQPALAVDNVIDTTGCGDAYQAAFTIEWLSSHDIPQAMQKGSEAASGILSHVGGVPWTSFPIEPGERL